MAENKQERKPVSGFSWLKLVLALLNAMVTGWLILVSWLVFLWWQHDFAYADNKASIWLHAAQTNWQHVLQNESHHTQFVLARVINDIATSSNKWMNDMKAQALQANTALHHDTLVKQNESDSDMQTTVNNIKQALQQTACLLLTTANIVLTKMLLFVLAIPLFLLALFVGLANGLMLRAVRKASLGRESAYLFHKLSSLFPSLLNVIICLFLVMPILILPQYLLVGIAVLSGLWLSQVASRFKKYV